MKIRKTFSVLIAIVIIICLISGCGTTPVSPSSTSESGSSSKPSESSSQQSSSNSEEEKNEKPYKDPATIEIDYVDNDPRGIPELSNHEVTLTPVNHDWDAEDSIPVYGKYQDIFPLVTNQTPVDEMVSQIEDPWLVCGQVFSTVYMCPMYYVDEMLDGISIAAIATGEGNATGIPANFLRKMDTEGWYYTVNKLEKGYVYSIFGPLMIENEDGSVEVVGTDPTDVYLYATLYSENVRSYSDFDSIEIGSSISDVIEVDSSALITLATHRYFWKNWEVPSYRIVRSYVLLTDGILVISYEPRVIKTFDYYGLEATENYGDDLVVCDMVYFPDFNYSPTHSGSVSDLSVYKEAAVVPMHIYSYDYPKQ